MFPACCKVLCVTPLSKVKKVIDMKTWKWSKVLENILLNHTKEHVYQYSILAENQSGFRGNYSCITALLKLNWWQIESFGQRFVSSFGTTRLIPKKSVL